MLLSVVVSICARVQRTVYGVHLGFGLGLGQGDIVCVCVYIYVYILLSC